MSYFSKAHLNPRGLDKALQSAALQGDAYLDHTLIWKLFPGDGHTRDFIFRKQVDDNGLTRYYIVSQRQPQAIEGLLRLQSKPYEPILQEGEWMHFDLRANPTITVREEGKTSSKRNDVLMHAKKQAQTRKEAPETMQAAINQAATDWVIKRATDWGLQLQADSLFINAYTQHKLLHKNRRIAFSSVDYSGAAQVIDPQKLATTLLHGTGHAKGFGCGLLLVKRLG